MFNEMLKNIVTAYGPSGRERAAAEVIKGYIADAADEIRYDAMGNLIALKKGVTGKKVMLSAHMDQIGFIVVDIDEKGFVRVGNVGGINVPASVGRLVQFENGAVGVLQRELKDVTVDKLDMQHLFIDLGVTSREAAENIVSIGDMCIYKPEFVYYQNRATSAYMDDRVCCAVVAEAFCTAKCPHDLYAVFTVQEEVGLRGAGAAAFAIDPDFNINLDVTPHGDTPKSADLPTKLGAGPTVKAMDRSVIVPMRVRKFMENTAREANIPFQNEVLRAGGTDTGAILQARGGISAGCVSIVTRYVHSPVETVDMEDVENAVKFVRAMCEKTELPTED